MNMPTTHPAIGASVDLQARGNDPPNEFRLFEFGEYAARFIDGSEVRGTFDQAAGEEVLAHWRERGHDLAIDYNHRSLEPGVDERVARAAGSFDLELRDDGLWAVNVQWTEAAERYIRSREYRYVSPVWNQVDGKPVEIFNVALTPNPAMLNYLPLVAHAQDVNPNPQGPDDREKGHDEMKTILAALGLSENASEAEAATRVAALQEFEAEALKATDSESRKAAVTAMAALAPLREFEAEVLKATASETREAAQGVLKAWQEAHTQLADVRQELEDIKESSAKAERDQMIAGAIKEGKLAPALKEWAESQPIDTLKSYLAAAPVIVKGEVREPQRDESVTMSQAIDTVRAELIKQGQEVPGPVDLAVMARKRFPHLAQSS